jgi:hypothetical protein
LTKTSPIFIQSGIQLGGTLNDKSLLDTNFSQISDGSGSNNHKTREISLEAEGLVVMLELYRLELAPQVQLLHHACLMARKKYD